MGHFYFQIGDNNPRYVEFTYNPGELEIVPRVLSALSRNARGDMKVASIYGKHLYDISIGGVWADEQTMNRLMSLKYTTEPVYFCPISLAGEIYRIEEDMTVTGGHGILQNTSANGINVGAVYLANAYGGTNYYFDYHPKLRQVFSTLGILTSNLIGNTYIAFGRDLHLAQGFRIAQSAEVGGINIKLSRSMYHTDNIPIYWEICATQGNWPNEVPGSVLRSGIITKPEITSINPNYTWLGIDVFPAISLIGDTLYWIKFYTDSEVIDGYIWQMDINNSYGGSYGGCGWLSTTGTRISYDFVFRICDAEKRKMVIEYTFNKILVNIETLSFSRNPGSKIGYGYKIMMESI